MYVRSAWHLIANTPATYQNLQIGTVDILVHHNGNLQNFAVKQCVNSILLCSEHEKINLGNRHQFDCGKEEKNEIRTRTKIRKIIDISKKKSKNGVSFARMPFEKPIRDVAKSKEPLNE